MIPHIVVNPGNRVTTALVQPGDDGGLGSRDSVGWVFMGFPSRWVQGERVGIFGWVGRDEVGGTEMSQNWADPGLDKATEAFGAF